MTEKTLKDLLSSLKTAGKPKTSAYDTTATVTRVENGIAWVHIPGGVRETPVKLTINAKAGDNVQVRVSGGRAFIVGNASAPPTDDHTAKQALAETRTVSKVVKAVREIAEKASRIAGNTNQYFWHTETGTDTGAHITEIPREDFLADPENGGGNLLARSNGVAVRDGLTELAAFLADTFHVGIDPNTKISYDPVNGLKLGENVTLSPSGVFKMKYGTQGSGDYYEFSVDVVNRYLYMNAIGNIMRMGADGYESIIENGQYTVNAPDNAIVLQSYHATSMSSTLAQLYLAYANGASEASLTADSISFTLPKGTLSANALFKAPGDTWTVDYAGGGYVTNNGKKFQWSVPTPYITGTVSVTALTGYIRQNGNYLVGSASVTGTFPIGNITVEKMTGFVRITYDASSAPTGVVNNDAISVQLHIVFRVA